MTADEMREIDRVTVDEFGLALLSMMENAGRTLAWHARDVATGPVIVVAGAGGNGGGGLTAARHLANRDVDVTVVLDRPSGDFDGPAGRQLGILEEMGTPLRVGPGRLDDHSGLLVDALVGYGLRGPLRGTARDLVQSMNEQGDAVVSLDVPSGRDATTGEVLGEAVTPDRIVTLALPKIGLESIDSPLFLADIGIPAAVFRRLGTAYEIPFGETDWVRVRPRNES